jgi:hypothetical protein
MLDESNLDFTIRQLRAQRDAVAVFDPETAAGMTTQLMKLAELKRSAPVCNSRCSKRHEHGATLSAQLWASVMWPTLTVLVAGLLAGLSGFC